MRRHTATSPCRICGGHETMPRGQGMRCAGFTSDDGGWVNCSRSERAGDLPLDERTNPPTYVHRMAGSCKCGHEHGPALLAQNGHAGPPRPPSMPPISAVYDYLDGDGALLYQTVRFEPKDFRQRRPDRQGGWIWKDALKDVQRVPYHLPPLLAEPSRTVFIVEGEKDADRLASLGLLATTNAGGAEKWTDDLSEHLRGRPHVVVLADNDGAGRRHVQQVARSVTAVAAVPDVRVIELPDLPEKGDVSDWLNAHHTIEELREVVKAAARWEPPAATVNDVSPARTDQPREGGFTLTHVGDLLAEPEEAANWLVDDVLPMGGLGFLAAKPKAGKSTLVRNLAMAVARGGEFLGRSCVQGTVIYLALEEKRSEVRRHFRQLGATAGDPLLVHIAKAPKDALADLLRLIREYTPILVIIDPLLRFTRVRDEKAYAELSNALEGVMAAAREWNCCIVATHHSPKAQGVETIDALLGSTALSGAPDTILVIRRRDQERTIESVQRYGADMERQLLELDGDGRLSLGVSVALAQRHAVEERIRELLKDGAEMTTDELREAADSRKASVVDALAALMSQAELAREGGGKKGDPFRYRNILYAVPVPTPGTAEQNPETGPNALQGNKEFRSHSEELSAPFGDKPGTAFEAPTEPVAHATHGLPPGWMEEDERRRRETMAASATPPGRAL